MTITREAVRGIVIHGNDSVILMHRIKNWSEYWVLPGGGIETWEDGNQAFIREMQEEIGADIQLANIQPVKTIQSTQNDVLNVQYIYECDYVSGKIGSGIGPEFTERLSQDNFYQMEVVQLSDVKQINLVPENIKNLVINKLVSRKIKV